MRRRASGCYKLLTILLDSQFEFISYRREVAGTWTYITSIRKLARYLGTDTSQVLIWLDKLVDLGYIVGEPRYVKGPRGGTQATILLRRLRNM